MKDEEMEDLEADGVSIEPQFYMDYEIDEDHTLRIFANRDEINKINLVKGTLAEKKNLHPQHTVCCQHSHFRE